MFGTLIVGGWILVITNVSVGGFAVLPTKYESFSACKEAAESAKKESMAPVYISYACIEAGKGNP